MTNQVVINYQITVHNRTLTFDQKPACFDGLLCQNSQKPNEVRVHLKPAMNRQDQSAFYADPARNRVKFFPGL
jgi:hypothetical protein